MFFQSDEQKLNILNKRLESFNAKYAAAKEYFEFMDKELEIALDPDKHYEGEYIDKLADERDKAWNKMERLRINVSNIECNILSLKDQMKAEEKEEDIERDT